MRRSRATASATSTRPCGAACRFRPVAPIVLHDDMLHFFGTSLASPYMSFAPRLSDRYSSELEDIAHVDGTARVQTVDVESDPWLVEVLAWIADLTGRTAILANTSLNTKGNPMTNTCREALEMLDTLPDLDLMYVEGWLFQKAFRVVAS